MEPIRVLPVIIFERLDHARERQSADLRGLLLVRIKDDALRSSMDGAPGALAAQPAAARGAPQPGPKT